MFLWQSAASASAGNNKGHFQYLRWLLPYTLIYVSAIICIYLDSDCIFLYHLNGKAKIYIETLINIYRYKSLTVVIWDFVFEMDRNTNN